MEKRNKFTAQGFTLIEILMVILLIAILATIGITQFTNFGKDAKDNATKANLQILRSGIAAQNGMMRVRCGIVSTNYPLLADIQNNNITFTNGATSPPVGGCNTVQITNTNDQLFFANSVPPNPWGALVQNTITQADAAGIANHALQCVGGGAHVATDDGWCYDIASGTIWANSRRNDGAVGGATGNEYTF